MANAPEQMPLKYAAVSACSSPDAAPSMVANTSAPATPPTDSAAPTASAAASDTLNSTFTLSASRLPSARAHRATAPVSRMPAHPENSMNTESDMPMAATAPDPSKLPAITLSIIMPSVADRVMRMDMARYLPNVRLISSLFSVCAPMAPYPSISPSMSAKKKRRFCSVSTMCTGLIWFGALPCMTRISRHSWLVSSCSTRAVAGANVPSSVM